MISITLLLFDVQWKLNKPVVYILFTDTKIAVEEGVLSTCCKLSIFQEVTAFVTCIILDSLVKKK